jgi:carbon monoxide dehydrogenase subunit G
MPNVQESIFVEAPPNDVWEFVSDIERYPEWIYFVREATPVSGGPVGEGTEYTERAKPGPFESVSEWQITEFEPPRRQTHIGRMAEMEATLRIRLEPEGEGTRWYHEMDFRMLPKIRLVGWVLERLVVRRKMQADFRRILKTAKGMLEREYATQEPTDAAPAREE